MRDDLLYYYDRSGLRRLFAALGRRVWPRFAALDGLLPPLLAPSKRRLDQEAAAAGGLVPGVG